MPSAQTSREFGPQSNRLNVKNQTTTGLLTLPDLLLVGYFSVEIAPVSVIHHDAEAPFVHERFLVSDDVRMSHRFEHVHLTHRSLMLKGR